MRPKPDIRYEWKRPLKLPARLTLRCRLHEAGVHGSSCNGGHSCDTQGVLQMSLTTYLAIALGLVIYPVQTFAVTVLHFRTRRLSTLVAAVGAWITTIGGLGTVFLLSSASSAQAPSSVALATDFTYYFAVSGAVSFAGMAAFAFGLLWFALQHPR
jgi:hypothetical protein